MLINNRQRVRTKIPVDPVTSSKSPGSMTVQIGVPLPYVLINVLFAFSTSQIFILSSNDISERLKKKLFLIFLPN